MIHVGNYYRLESPSWLGALPLSATPQACCLANIIGGPAGLMPGFDVSTIERLALVVPVFAANSDAYGNIDVSFHIRPCTPSGPIAQQNITTLTVAAQKLAPSTPVALEFDGQAFDVPNMQGPGGLWCYFYWFMDGNTFAAGATIDLALAGWQCIAPAGLQGPQGPQGPAGSCAAHTHPLAVGGSSVNTGEPVSG